MALMVRGSVSAEELRHEDWLGLQVEHRSHCAIAITAFESLDGGLFPYVTGRADEDPDQTEGEDDRTEQVQGCIHGRALQSLR